MANLYVTEFAASANSKSGAQLQVGNQPAVAQQKLDIGVASLQSLTFDERTHFVRLHAVDACHVLFGVDPTATTNHMHMSAGSVEYFGVRLGDKLAVIASAHGSGA